MIAASWAGSGFVLWPLGALIVLLMARAGREREGALFAVAVVGANLISESLKLFFHRMRPEPWFGYPLPSSYSFPSGHAFVSFCFCLCLAEVVVRDEWPASAQGGGVGRGDGVYADDRALAGVPGGALSDGCSGGVCGGDRVDDGDSGGAPCVDYQGGALMSF